MDEIYFDNKRFFSENTLKTQEISHGERYVISILEGFKEEVNEFLTSTKDLELATSMGNSLCNKFDSIIKRADGLLESNPNLRHRIRSFTGDFFTRLRNAHQESEKKLKSRARLFEEASEQSVSRINNRSRTTKEVLEELNSKFKREVVEYYLGAMSHVENNQEN